jgi:hypothetical protein
MTSRPATGFRRSIHAAFAIALGACHGSAPQAPAPAEFNRSPYREAAESAAVSAADEEAIYLTVLEFFRPSGQQMRWLDREVLPAARGDSIGALDSALVTRLILALGPSHFCTYREVPACSGRPGGSLRLSQVYGQSPDRARVVVHFEGYSGPYAPGTAFSDTEVFLVARQKDKWRIEMHAAAAK